MPRWDWTWEERAPTGEPVDQLPLPAPPPAPAPPDPTQFRRRRVAALIGAFALLVLLAAAISTLGGGRRARAVHLAVVKKQTVSQAQAQLAHREEEAIDRVLAYTPVITQGADRGDEVALTFDDGPGPYTQQLVNVLNSYHVKATFFAVGEEERYFSAGTLAELNSGDVIGNHTETHPMMASLSRHDQHEQLFEQMARIELLGGRKPRLFRPPYGSFDSTTMRQLHSFHLLMVLWSTDTQDYTRPGVQAIVQNALAGARPGAIILMHDAGGDRSQTVAALPAIITGLRNRGLHPVTVPRLLLDDPPTPGQQIPQRLAGD